MRDYLEKIMELVEEAWTHGCLYLDDADPDDMDTTPCLIQHEKLLIEYENMCICCKAAYLASRENLTR